MPIDPDFRKKREKAGEEKGTAVWGPVDPPERLGIRGTYVAVDWDICTGCGTCLKVCPLELFDWAETPSHPTSEKKAFPCREMECVQCFKCEARCPVQAVVTSYPGLTGWMNVLAWVTFVSAFLAPIGGTLYGVLFGPALGLHALFYLGWAVLVFGLLMVVSSLMCFAQRGKPLEGRGIMSTTVLVRSGTYGIIRHPQFLGVSLATCSSMLISQHWFFLLFGVLLIATFPKWIKDSEKNLIAKFGDDYRHYMREVPGVNLLLGIARQLRRRGNT